MDRFLELVHAIAGYEDPRHVRLFDHNGRRAVSIGIARTQESHLIFGGNNQSRPSSIGASNSLFASIAGAYVDLCQSCRTLQGHRVTAAQNPREIAAIVSRGGRPDMAGAALAQIQAPTLLIVGGSDIGVLELNEDAYAELNCTKHLHIVPGATHLFEEPGTLDEVVEAAGAWFTQHLQAEEK